MSLRKDELIPTVYYPESDDKPMAETDVHRRMIVYFTTALENFFRDEPNIYVSGDLLLYYAEGDPRKCVAPDVFVVRGVPKINRRIYKLWEEARPPDVVFEFSSRQTWREDLHVKWRLYEQLGVKEYFIFDPEYDYLVEPLVAYRLEEGQYAPLEIQEGRVRSEALGLDVVDTGETLRLFDPQTGKFLLTPAEEAEALRQAQTEAARLRQELDQLKHQPHPKN
jgi:Uma2 family endonuclease